MDQTSPGLETTHTQDRTIRDLFIRVCRDAGYHSDGVKAAILTAKVFGISPLQVWCAVGSLETMHRLADGTHPYYETSGMGGESTGRGLKPQHTGKE